MRVLVTGAAGYLATEAVRQLAENGHQLKLVDILDMETDHEFEKCSILEPDEITPAIEGVDVIFHTVVGGGRRETNTPADRVWRSSKHFELTVMGTFNVMQAAKEMGVPKVVCITSEAARGQRIPITDVEICDEETPAKPDYVYALGKYVQEIIGEYTTRIEGVKTICLRNAWFGAASGKSVQAMGSSLLIQRSVTRKDLVRAAVLSIEDETLDHEVFMLCNKTDFTREDVPALRKNAADVMEKYYPGSVALLKEYGIDIDKIHESKNLYKLDDSSKAKRLLGWEPTFCFRDFYENLKAGKYSKDHVFVEE